MEPFGDEAEGVAGKEERFAGKGGRFVNRVGDEELVGTGFGGEGDYDLAPVEEFGDAVADGVFDERLEGEGGDFEVGGWAQAGRVNRRRARSMSR